MQARRSKVANGSSSPTHSACSWRSTSQRPASKADQGFAGRLVDWTSQILGRELGIVRRDPGQRSFQVQPKRWVIERTLSWITAHRRLARDYESSPAHSEAMIRWAMIEVMVRPPDAG